MIAIVDYGVGNLFSLKSSLKYIGFDAVVSNDAAVIKAADKVILPGVGAFGDAADKLRKSGMDVVVKEVAASGKPLLGICVGMQLMFERSFEYGEHEGLGLVKGSVKDMREVIPQDYKVPHIGWNALKLTKPDSEIFKYIEEGDCMYFVHSFYGADCDAVTATTEYGAELCAAIQNGNVYGTQFHPEKSGTCGLKILKAFCELEG